MMSHREDLIREYANKSDAGALACNRDQREEWKKKRREENEKFSSYKVIIAPHSASFKADRGNGFFTFHGKCPRAVFLDEIEAVGDETEDGISLRRMEFGRMSEEREHAYESKSGILTYSNIRVSKEVTKDILLSCEIDSIVNILSKKVIIEHKTYDGYYAKKTIQGNKSTVPMPKMEHLAQVMLYLAIAPNIDSEIKEAIIHYRTRAELYPTYHFIELNEIKNNEGDIIDALPIINGVEHNLVSVRTLMTNAVSLANHIMQKKIPPRGPEYCYSEDKIRYLLEMGDISKKQYKEWQDSGARVGDWNCNKKYCPYYSACIGSNPEIRLPTDEEVMKSINQSKIVKSDDTELSMWQ